MRRALLHSSFFRTIPIALGAISLAIPAAAQSDDCATATVISGTGSFPFDTTGFGPSGHGFGVQGCSFIFLPRPIEAAGFYQWTAPSAGDFFVRGPVGHADVMSFYDGGGCSTTCLGGNAEDGTSPTSPYVLLENVQAGQVVLMEIGSYAQNPGGVGTLTIETAAQVCASLSADPYEPNDSCATPAILPGMGTYSELTLQSGDSDFYQLFVPAQSVLVGSMSVPGAVGDLKLYDANCQPIANPAAAGRMAYRNVGTLPKLITVEVGYQSSIPNWDCRPYALSYQTAPDPCAGVADDALGDNETCSTATPLALGSSSFLFERVTFDDPDVFAFDLSAGNSTEILIDNLDPQVALSFGLRRQSDANCGEEGIGAGLTPTIQTSVGQTSITLTNLGTSSESYALRISMRAPTTAGSATCTEYILQRVADSGSSICEASPNSTGLPCTLTGVLGSGVGSNLHLDATQGPPGQFGYFLVGTGYQAAGITPISNGSLCLTGQIGRYNFFGFGNDPGGISGTQSLGTFSASGQFQNPFGNATSTGGLGFDVPTRLPFPTGPTLGAGASLTFQLWYRDNPAGTGQSNLSNGYFVQFP